MLPDVQKSVPPTKLDIEKVCVKRVYRRVCLRPSSEENFCLDVKLDACIDLPRIQRGIHVSRSVEAIIESIKDNVDGNINILEDLLKNMTRTLLGKHEYASKVSASIKTVYLHRIRDADIGVEDFIPVKIYMKDEMNRNGEEMLTVAVEIMGMTVCPCAQQVYAFLEGLQTPNAPSHSQRVKLRITIKTRGKTIDIKHLIYAGLNSFSAPLYYLLKRGDEYRLVKKAFSSPRFIEDVVRESLNGVYRMCRDSLSDDSIIVVEATSYESIHPYDLYAKASYSMGQLKKMLENV